MSAGDHDYLWKEFDAVDEEMKARLMWEHLMAPPPEGHGLTPEEILAAWERDVVEGER